MLRVISSEAGCRKGPSAMAAPQQEKAAGQTERAGELSRTDHGLGPLRVENGGRTGAQPSASPGPPPKSPGIRGENPK